MGLKHTIYSETASLPDPVLHSYRLRAPSGVQPRPERAVLRGVDVLQLGLGSAARRERGHQHRRHDHDRGRLRDRQARVEGQLQGHDRPQPARVRPQAGELRAELLHADPRVQLRARRRPPGVVARAGSRSWAATARPRPICPRRRSPSPWPRPSGRRRSTREGVEANSSSTVFQSIAAYMAPSDAVPPPPVTVTHWLRRTVHDGRFRGAAPRSASAASAMRRSMPSKMYRERVVVGHGRGACAGCFERIGSELVERIGQPLQSREGVEGGEGHDDPALGDGREPEAERRIDARDRSPSDGSCIVR